jgi:ribonuclease I
VESIPKMGSCDLDLAEAFRVVLGPGARKQLARETAVSPDAVKKWFAGEWPASRRNQLNDVLIRHVEHRQRMLNEILRRLTERAA